MRKLSTIVVGVVAGAVAHLAFAATAHAAIVEYISQHPVPHKFGGGFCTIDVAHIHNYPPGEPRMYRDIGGKFYFVGDPTPFQYDGPRHTYYGSHPIVDAEVHFDHPIYCYMKGPHYHWYQPPAQAQFEMRGGAYWYVGSFPQAYYDDRPRFAVVNEAYAPMPYVRPVVDIHVAPPVVQAEVAIGGPGWRASAVVGAPFVPVVAPPVPVPVPVPFGVGVGVGVPGPVIVGGRYHHDHGRHEGWREHDEGWREHREGWREHDHFRDHGHRGPPGRFVANPAPVQRPFFGRNNPPPHFAPQHGAPMRGPAPGPARPNRHR